MFTNPLSTSSNFNTFLDFKSMDKLNNYNLLDQSYNTYVDNKNIDFMPTLGGKDIEVSNYSEPQNTKISYNNSNIRSSNKQLLPTDRTVRLVSISDMDSISTKTSNNLNTRGTHLNKLVLNTQTVFPSSHIPTSFFTSNLPGISYDSFSIGNSTPEILRSKEESAPNFIFNTY